MGPKNKGLTCCCMSMRLCLLICVICTVISYFLCTTITDKISIEATKQFIFKSQISPFLKKKVLPETRGEHLHKSHGNITNLTLHLNSPLPLKSIETTPIHEEMYRDPVPYEFIIQEEDKCKDTAPFLVFLICTTENEKLRRDNIRKTWGDENLVPGFPVVRLFMLGVQKQGSTEAIRNESRMYRDIIQQDFQDTYHNLTIKVLMGMKWVALYCPNAHFVMKTDSDMFVNTEYLIQELLVKVPPSEFYFTGYPMRKHQPIRNEGNKWYVPVDLFPDNLYPDFCSGTGYVFSGMLANMIYRTSFGIKILYLEDVYVGICLQKIGVIVSTPPRLSLFNPFKVPFSPCVYNKIITSHHISPDELLLFWNLKQIQKPYCFSTSKSLFPHIFLMFKKKITHKQKNPNKSHGFT